MSSRANNGSLRPSFAYIQYPHGVEVFSKINLTDWNSLTNITIMNKIYKYLLIPFLYTVELYIRSVYIASGLANLICMCVTDSFLLRARAAKVGRRAGELKEGGTPALTGRLP